MMSVFSFHLTLVNKKLSRQSLFHLIFISLILGNKQLWRQSFHFIFISFFSKYWETKIMTSFFSFHLTLVIKNYVVSLFISSNIGKQKIITSFFSFHLILGNKQLWRQSFHLIFSFRHSNLFGETNKWRHLFISSIGKQKIFVILLMSSNIGKQTIMTSFFSFHQILGNKQLWRHSFHFI